MADLAENHREDKVLRHLSNPAVRSHFRLLVIVPCCTKMAELISIT
jgi:hypothetical protein